MKTKHEIYMDRCRHIMDEKHIKLRAKNLWKPGKEGAKTGTFYRTHLTIEDATGFKCPVYCRNKPQWYVDIPIGSNDLGMIWEGHFLFFGVKAHPWTLDASDALKKRSEYMIKNDKRIIDMAAAAMAAGVKKEA